MFYIARVNNRTGERTYEFINGSPVSPMASTVVNPYPTQTNRASWGYPASPSTSAYGGEMMGYRAGYGAGTPPINPGGDGSLAHRLQKYYIRPTSQQRSWMWR